MSFFIDRNGWKLTSTRQFEISVVIQCHIETSSWSCYSGWSNDVIFVQKNNVNVFNRVYLSRYFYLRKPVMCSRLFLERRGRHSRRIKSFKTRTHHYQWCMIGTTFIKHPYYDARFFFLLCLIDVKHLNKITFLHLQTM